MPLRGNSPSYPSNQEPPEKPGGHPTLPNEPSDDWGDGGYFSPPHLEPIKDPTGKPIKIPDIVK